MLNKQEMLDESRELQMDKWFSLLSAEPMIEDEERSESHIFLKLESFNVWRDFLQNGDVKEKVKFFEAYQIDFYQEENMYHLTSQSTNDETEEVFHDWTGYLTYLNATDVFWVKFPLDYHVVDFDYMGEFYTLKVDHILNDHYLQLYRNQPLISKDSDKHSPIVNSIKEHYANLALQEMSKVSLIHQDVPLRDVFVGYMKRTVWEEIYKSDSHTIDILKTYRRSLWESSSDDVVFFRGVWSSSSEACQALLAFFDSLEVEDYLYVVFPTVHPLAAGSSLNRELRPLDIPLTTSGSLTNDTVADHLNKDEFLYLYTQY